MAECDAQHLGELLPLAAAPVTFTPRAANENAVPLAHTEGRESAADPSGGERTTTHQRSGHAHVSTPSPGEKAAVSEKVSGAADTTLSERAAGADTRPHPRAQQNIPPALRRAVLARDRRRCRAPGCAHATFVDVHHVQPRAEGGRNEAENLLTLCGSHHRAIHRGELLIEREPDGALVFRHADGAAYGDPIDPRLIDAHAKVFSALRHLGFREGEVKEVLSALRADGELDGASVERLLREALCRIRPKSR
jgi:hypothetical protein